MWTRCAPPGRPANARRVPGLRGYPGRRRSSRLDNPVGRRGPPRRAGWSSGGTRRPAHPTGRVRSRLRCSASLRPLGLKGEGSVPLSAFLCRKPLLAATPAGNALGVCLSAAQPSQGVEHVTTPMPAVRPRMGDLIHILHPLCNEGQTRVVGDLIYNSKDHRGSLAS